MPRMLDLFAGLGGASQAMRARGWQVVTVELDPKFRPNVVADVSRLPIRGQFDLIWASPPCTEFSRESMPWCRTGNAPSLELWQAAERAIAELRPRWWVIENVKGAVPWIGRQPQRRIGPFYLWGRMPAFKVRGDLGRKKESFGSRQRAERAKVPMALSLALAEAVERDMRIAA